MSSNDRLRVEGDPERIRECGWRDGASGVSIAEELRSFMSPEYLEGYDAGRKARVADRKAREEARDRRAVGEE